MDCRQNLIIIKRCLIMLADDNEMKCNEIAKLKAENRELRGGRR